MVEVRQGTLGVDGRGCGPAGNTGRGWSWLRSNSEHYGSRVAVEQEDEDDEDDEEDEEEEERRRTRRRRSRRRRRRRTRRQLT